MILWLFIILDMFTLASITLIHFDIFFAWYLISVSVTYLVLKGVIFFGEPMSMVDFLIGIYLLLMLVGIQFTYVYYFIIFWFSYKLFFTVLG